MNTRDCPASKTRHFVGIRRSHAIRSFIMSWMTATALFYSPTMRRLYLLRLTIKKGMKYDENEQHYAHAATQTDDDDSHLLLNRL